MGEAVRALLEAAGLDVESPQLKATPGRVATAWTESFLDGYQADPARILAETYGVSASTRTSGMVLLKDVPFHGLCPHHLLPFRGRAHLAYLPGRKLASLSSLARLVDCFAHRLEIQEVVTRQVAEALTKHLGALGAAVALDTDQSCMTMRSPERRGTRTATQHFTGAFAKRSELRAEFLSSLRAL
jgi:GTP cyclohydrolase I